MLSLKTKELSSAQDMIQSVCREIRFSFSRTWLIHTKRLSDTGFHAAEGDPANLKLCPRGAWEDRMLVETVLSMLTLVCHVKKVMHRGWAYFQARLAFTMAAFNVLVQWHGFQPTASGFVPLSIAEFSL